MSLGFKRLNHKWCVYEFVIRVFSICLYQKHFALVALIEYKGISAAGSNL